ncbi:hypothetical protein SCHPADRAFT_937703 [Schizopora paradoxa]|uniref:BTB domain-containing protein n=1 Tax=Schizopora paradoxa TaxID=27342 RepID=A0A0H2RYH1_9AGAM|nr:hypothetical protein SCHPADRAFT_937703 [Schizopora paradoxa]
MDVDANSLNSPKPHEILWYSDGSVVLATDVYLFKVHKSVLSIHSSVFKDMFELSNIGYPEATGVGHGEAQETYDGLPLVHLVGDRGEDVVHLLRTVYEPRYYDRCSDKTPLHIVVALLLLSTKYDFKTIRKDVMAQISRHYPLELSTYLSSNVGHSPLFGMKRRDCDFTLLAAAFKADADILLPALYFTCADSSMEDILELSLSLPPECLKILLKGRDALRESIVMLIANLPRQLERGVDQKVCSGSGEEPCLATAVFDDLQDIVNTCYRFVSGSALIERYMDEVCAKCEAFMGNEVDRWRNAIRIDSLSDFGFTEWAELQEEYKKLSES